MNYEQLRQLKEQLDDSTKDKILETMISMLSILESVTTRLESLNKRVEQLEAYHIRMR